VRIPAVGIDAEVRSVGFVLLGGQLQYDTPRFEAGQYTGSADPGQAGNLVIGGHIANRGAAAVFSQLPQVKIGDVVEVFSGPAMFRYSITELRVVAPDATAVMARTHDATLTLITCSPDASHRDRVVVVGKLLQGPAQAG
jgi:sortase A